MLRPAVPTLLVFAVVACSKRRNPCPARARSVPVAVPGQTGLFAEPLPARAKLPTARASRGSTRSARASASRTSCAARTSSPTSTPAPGLAVGDYDGDGWPDVYLVSQDGPNKLFRQTAPLVFEDVTARRVVSTAATRGAMPRRSPTSTATRDLDLYVCNLESPNLLYVNQGDGTFVEKAGPFGLGLVGREHRLCVRRLRQRRRPRPLRADQPRAEAPAAGRDRRRRHAAEGGAQDEGRAAAAVSDVREGRARRPGRADGLRGPLLHAAGLAGAVPGRAVRSPVPQRRLRALRRRTKEAGIADHGNGLSVVWWDFDGDGRMDLYVANDFQSPDQLYRNLGDGRFVDVTKERLPHTAFFGMGCDFGDLDHDGRFDLCVADMSSTQHYWGKMLMGSMDQHRWFLMHAEPQQYMRNALYVNTGRGPGRRFLEAAHLAGLASTDWTWAVRFADLDDDGWLDFYATNGIPVFTDNPDTGERFAKLWREGARQQALELFRAIPSVAEKNVARRNDGAAVGGLHFTDAGAEWGLDESSVAHGAVVVRSRSRRRPRRADQQPERAVQPVREPRQRRASRAGRAARWQEQLAWRRGGGRGEGGWGLADGAGVVDARLHECGRRGGALRARGGDDDRRAGGPLAERGDAALREARGRPALHGGGADAAAARKAGDRRRLR
jgi:hypothetical protein